MTELTMLRGAVYAAPMRHIYLPLEAELSYFTPFQHDKDMGVDGQKTVYPLARASAGIRAQQSPFRLASYEARAMATDLSFSALLQRGLQVKLLSQTQVIASDLSRHLAFDDIKASGPVSKCLSRDGTMTIGPLTTRLSQPHFYQIIFRPLTAWPQRLLGR